MRGVTPAGIRDIRWSFDGLWCGFVSDKGTLRAVLFFFFFRSFMMVLMSSGLDVYALNPQGGETDGMSQIYGRVLNSAKRPLVCASSPLES
jgi:hypothetical protein